MSWYEVDENMEREIGKNRIEKKKNYRFWIRRGESANVAFMSNTAIIFREHGVKLYGKWGHYFTCLSHLKDERGLPLSCPLCKDGTFKAVEVAVFPILNLTPFVTQDGRKIEFYRQIFVMTPSVYKLFKQRAIELKEEGKDIKGAVFKVTKVDKTTLLDYKKHVNLEDFTIKGETVEPLDIGEVCKPNPQEVRAVMEALEKTRERVSIKNKPNAVNSEDKDEIDITDLDEAPF